MKKILLSFVIVSTFAACNNNDKTDTTQRNIQLLRDSTVYTNSNIYSDTMANVTVEEPVIQKPVTVIATPKAPQRKVVSVPAKTVNKAPVYTEKKEEKVETTVATPPINSGSGQNSEVGSSNGNTGNTGSTVPQVEKKKGWNKATTGAVIGGAAGAAGGAIISKKKGVGAVVGAVVGAASGYIIGKDMDKKDKKN